MPRKCHLRHQQPYNPYAGLQMNPYGNNFRHGAHEATEGMVDVAKVVTAGAVTIAGLGLLGSMFPRP